jgi:cell wall-associated NlpC family hydrolase
MLCFTLALGACASAPSDAPSPAQARVSDEQADEAAQAARTMLGKPYRYGGDTPAGFDCSGLVNYSYARVGVAVARDTRGLRQQSMAVPVRTLRPGDLVFFDQEGKKASHVGIYVGNRRFVHAPSSGGKVRTDMLDADYWSRHFVEARRI